MANYYHVMLVPKPGVNPKRIEKKFNYALDWFRLNDLNWVIYTSRDAETWYFRLKEFVQPGGNLFICKLDVSERHGWISKTFWEWLKQDRSQKTPR